MDEGIVLEGLRFMVVGMGVVFCFLVLMVLAMQGMASFFRKFGHLFPEPQEAAHAAPAASKDDPGIAVAIAAVHALKS